MFLFMLFLCFDYVVCNTFVFNMLHAAFIKHGFVVSKAMLYGA